jgi:hypothetical protein
MLDASCARVCDVLDDLLCLSFYTCSDTKYMRVDEVRGDSLLILPAQLAQQSLCVYQILAINLMIPSPG